MWTYVVHAVSSWTQNIRRDRKYLSWYNRELRSAAIQLHVNSTHTDILHISFYGGKFRPTTDRNNIWCARGKRDSTDYVPETNTGVTCQQQDTVSVHHNTANPKLDIRDVKPKCQANKPALLNTNMTLSGDSQLHPNARRVLWALHSGLSILFSNL